MAPTAVLTAPAQIFVGETITLDASQSSDIGDGIANYTWRHIQGSGGTAFGNAPFVTAPGNLTLPITAGASTSPPLAPGQHRFSLTVRDHAGNLSVPAEVSFTVVQDSTPPNAVLTAPTQVLVGETITLDASQSNDSGTGIANYTWRHIQGSGGTAFGNAPFVTAPGNLTLPITAGASTSPPLEPGTHRFQLRVTDNAGNLSQPAQVEFEVVANDTTAPTAVLDVPQSVAVGQSITLNGNRSSDQGGQIVEYRWTGLGAGGANMPPNQTVTTNTPTFTVQMNASVRLAPGRHRFRLVVVDDSGNASQPAEAEIVVRDNAPPVAVLQGPAQIRQGEPLQLDGRRSSDQGGRIVKYTWTHLQGGGGTIRVNQPVETREPTITVEQPANNHLAAGAHRFRLVVIDDSGNESQPVERNVTVIAVDTPPPIGAVNGPREIAEGTELKLDASRSRDPDGQIAVYRWTHKAGNGGAMGSGKPVEVKTASFVVPQDAQRLLAPSRHSFELVVIDAAGNESKPVQATVIVTAVDRTPPTAVINAPRQITGGSGLKLDGSRSRDPDKGGRVVLYRWTHASGVGGLMRPGKPVETKTPSFEVPQDAPNPLRPGRHVLELVVVDAAGNESKPARATVSVAAAAAKGAAPATRPSTIQPGLAKPASAAPSLTKPVDPTKK